jgi:hypothetical protein
MDARSGSRSTKLAEGSENQQELLSALITLDVTVLWCLALSAEFSH